MALQQNATVKDFYPSIATKAGAVSALQLAGSFAQVGQAGQSMVRMYSAV